MVHFAPFPLERERGAQLFLSKPTRLYFNKCLKRGKSPPFFLLEPAEAI